MKILFAISVVSFAALVWAVLAIVRHVRKNSARAAAQPAAEAELSQAIDVRISQITRQPQAQRKTTLSETQQDFSYFNRDATSAPADMKPFADSSAPIKPATVDRS